MFGKKNRSNKMQYIIVAAMFLSAIFKTSPGFSAVDEPLKALSHADSLLLAKKYFSYAIQFKDIGNSEEALKNYRRSIACNDSVYQVHYSFGDFLLKSKRKDDARNEFNRALMLNPSHYNSAAMLALLYSEAAMYDSTLTMYETMSRIKPENVAILVSIASLQQHLGHTGKALNSYIKLLERDALSSENAVTAGLLALQHEKWKLAAAFGGHLHTLAKETALADSIMITAYSKSGDFKRALEQLKLQAKNSNLNEELLTQLEEMARKSNDTAIVKETLLLRLTQNPKDSTAYGELAELMIKDGELKEAIIIIDKGLKRYPSDGKLFILRGNMFDEAGDTEAALAAYEKALADDLWRESARQFIWRIRPPQTDEEKAELEFFKRGKKSD